MNESHKPLIAARRLTALVSGFALLMLVSPQAHSQSTVKKATPKTQPSKANVKGFKTDIQKEALENKNFRKVLYTAPHLQLVLMSLKGGEDIGSENHPNDQFFRFESGRGKCIINGHEYAVKAGDAIVIPAGAQHNVINVDPKAALKMYTIYSPPNHQDGLVRATKKEAEEHGVKFDGKTTE